MSDLSDQIEDQISKLAKIIAGEQTKNFTVLTKEDMQNMFNCVEPEAFHVAYRTQTVMTLTQAYRKMAGQDPFTNAEDAKDRTSKYVPQYCAHDLIRAFSDGVLLSQDSSSAARKLKLFNQLDGVFEHDGFRAESDLYVMTLRGDSDLEQLAMRHCTAALDSSFEMSGLKYAPTEAANKIWDMWLFSLSSQQFTYYLAGQMLGKKWVEDDVLKGIVEATDG